MSKTLKIENDSLKLENEHLKNQIQQLNENTVIESMNDMKIKLQELEDSSVPLSLFSSLHHNYKQCFNISISINNINNIIKNELKSILYTDFTDEYKDKIIESTINSLSLVSKIIKNHEEWDENICHCDNI